MILAHMCCSTISLWKNMTDTVLSFFCLQFFWRLLQLLHCSGTGLFNIYYFIDNIFGCVYISPWAFNYMNQHFTCQLTPLRGCLVCDQNQNRNRNRNRNGLILQNVWFVTEIGIGMDDSHYCCLVHLKIGIEIISRRLNKFPREIP